MPNFTHAADLLRWLEDEYLSELLLRSIKPRPGQRPPKNGVALLEWGLVLPAARKLQMYNVRAEGVSIWALDGVWDNHAACQLFDVVDEAAGIALRQKAPGTLSLVCKRITVERGTERRYTPPPAIDPSSLLIWGPREVAWTSLLQWIKPPADFALFEQRGERSVRVDPETYDEIIKSPYLRTFRIQRETTDEVPWLWLNWMLAITTVGHYIQLRRGTLDDVSWARAQRLPAHLAPCSVLSGSVRATGEEWLARWLVTTE